MEESTLTDEQIKKRFNELLINPNINAQMRGFEFEKLIKSKLENENLEPKAGYKPQGEQIDGSFFWNGATFLLEAKWVKDKIPASSIYSFKGKVEGKFHTTSGVFLSVNGYSDDVNVALKSGKSLNILLFDSEDISLIFNLKASFIEVLKFKLREAGDTGNINAPFKLSLEIDEIKESDSVEVLIFIEGKSDIKLITEIMKEINFYHKFNFRVIPMNGVENINKLPTLINIYGENSYIKTVLVLLDEDFNSSSGRRSIKKVKKLIKNSSMSINTQFFFIPELVRDMAESGRISQDILKTNSVIENIRNHINFVFEEYYYDPETDTPLETFERLMSTAEWDFEENLIRFPEDTDWGDKEIKSAEELVEYLDEAAILEMNGTMPISWLKEQPYLDYQDEAREYIWSNFEDDLLRLNWINEYE